MVLQPYEVENPLNYAAVKVPGLHHLVGLFVIIFNTAGKVIIVRQQFPGQVPVIPAGMYQALDNG